MLRPIICVVGPCPAVRHPFCSRHHASLKAFIVTPSTLERLQTWQVSEQEEI